MRGKMQMKGKESDLHAMFHSLTSRHVCKPRRRGLSMVIDTGCGPSMLADHLALWSDYVDELKLGFGTVALMPRDVLREKIDIAKKFGIDVFPGGTLFEASVREGCWKTYISQVREAGFTAVEIADGIARYPVQKRIDAIRAALDLGLKVFTEVGSKDPGDQPSDEELAQQILLDRQAGADKVIFEARTSGKSIGIYDALGRVQDGRLDRILERVDDLDAIIWEAPLREQQVHLIKRLGPNVNLGNIRMEDVFSLECFRCGLRSETFHEFHETGGRREQGNRHETLISQSQSSQATVAQRIET
jgi:phosphosulfolactate synthase